MLAVGAGACLLVDLCGDFVEDRQRLQAEAGKIQLVPVAGRHLIPYHRCRRNFVGPHAFRDTGDLTIELTEDGPVVVRREGLVELLRSDRL